MKVSHCSRLFDMPSRELAKQNWWPTSRVHSTGTWCIWEISVPSNKSLWWTWKLTLNKQDQLEVSRVHTHTTHTHYILNRKVTPKTSKLANSALPDTWYLLITKPMWRVTMKMIEKKNHWGQHRTVNSSHPAKLIICFLKTTGYHDIRDFFYNSPVSSFPILKGNLKKHILGPRR